MLRIRLLGGLSVDLEGRALAGAATQPRRLAVLALIASAGDRGITRDRLIALLWMDTPEESARRALAQALHALRKDLGEDSLFTGVQELRLNRDVVACDLLDFDDAVAARDHERAVSSYGGPFLHGFRLPAAAELDRWIEEERSRLAHRHAQELELLARGAAANGDAVTAAQWWRRLAALDPLNARIAIELMRSLTAAGERHAALQHARIYEALLDQELAIEPDRELLALVESIRRAPADPADAPAPAPVPGPAPARSPAPAAATESRPELVAAGSPTARTAPLAPVPPAAAIPPAGEAAADGPSLAQMASRQRSRRVATAAAIVIALAAAGTGRVLRQTHAPPSARSILAVGRIVDFRSESGRDADPVAEMLATNLARVSGLQVLSSTRVLELLRARSRDGDDRGAWAEAARQAGASELVEGGLHQLGPDRLLLDLRRIDLRNGVVLTALRLEGSDVFEVVGSATGEIAAALGHPVGRLDPADVTTRSLVGYRFYEEGLHAYTRGDFRAAEQLFDAALREDSSFAMAAYYRWMAQLSRGGSITHAELARLRVLSARASDRERLLIQGTLAMAYDEREFLAIADTLAVRYPAELEGHYLLGFARMRSGEFGAALPHLRRVIELDSLSLRGASGRCLACDGTHQIVYALSALDSLASAESYARAWLRHDGESPRAWATLAGALLSQSRYEEAIHARRMATRSGPYDVHDAVFPAAVRVHAGDFEAADRVARSLILDPADDDVAGRAVWLLMVSLRHQGRWSEALDLVRLGSRALPVTQREGEPHRIYSLAAAQIHLEAGRPARAAAIWDSLAVNPIADDTESLRIRNAALMYTLAAAAYAAAGDTIRLMAVADSVAALADRGISQRAHHFASYTRGLRAVARADTTRAIEEFRRAIYAPALGLTRMNRDLAELLIAVGRYDEAFPVLRSALRGGLDGVNLYVTLTDLHELLAQAYAARGQADSAAFHYRYVAAALANADAAAQHRLHRARLALSMRAE